MTRPASPERPLAHTGLRDGIARVEEQTIDGHLSGVVLPEPAAATFVPVREDRCVGKRASRLQPPFDGFNFVIAAVFDLLARPRATCFWEPFLRELRLPAAFRVVSLLQATRESADVRFDDGDLLGGGATLHSAPR
jgi:hypothetical protein